LYELWNEPSPHKIYVTPAVSCLSAVLSLRQITSLKLVFDFYKTNTAL